MKKALVLAVLAIMSLSCEQDKFKESAAISEIGILIDVRTAGEYSGGHLDRAINIPYDEIGQRIGEHVQDKEGDITLYCRSGRRSAIAKETLDGLGYKRVRDAGAYTKLKAQQENTFQ